MVALAGWGADDRIAPTVAMLGQIPKEFHEESRLDLDQTRPEKGLLRNE
jgi:hypothetical protein